MPCKHTQALGKSELLFQGAISFTTDVPEAWMRGELLSLKLWYMAALGCFRNNCEPRKHNVQQNCTPTRCVSEVQKSIVLAS